VERRGRGGNRYMTSTGHQDYQDGEGGNERQERTRNGSHQSSVIQCKAIYRFPHPLLTCDFYSAGKHLVINA